MTPAVWPSWLGLAACVVGVLQSIAYTNAPAALWAAVAGALYASRLVRLYGIRRSLAGLQGDDRAVIVQILRNLRRS